MFKETSTITNTGNRSNLIQGVKELIMRGGVESTGDVAAWGT